MFLIWLMKMRYGFRPQEKISFTKAKSFGIIHLKQKKKRNDEESTPAKALQRTSPRDPAAERDGAGGMWKMASEQRTEPQMKRFMRKLESR